MHKSARYLNTCGAAGAAFLMLIPVNLRSEISGSGFKIINRLSWVLFLAILVKRAILS
jgi:hypothetical protein